MPSATYRIFRDAILREQQVICTYNGYPRELCPHIIGHKDGEETVLAYQFGGKTSSHLPPGGQWRCFKLSDIRNAEARDGAWHTGPSHQSFQSCVDVIDLDVNIHVRKPPRR